MLLCWYSRFTDGRLSVGRVVQFIMVVMAGTGATGASLFAAVAVMLSLLLFTAVDVLLHFVGTLLLSTAVDVNAMSPYILRFVGVDCSCISKLVGRCIHVLYQ